MKHRIEIFPADTQSTNVIQVHDNEKLDKPTKGWILESDSPIDIKYDTNEPRTIIQQYHYWIYVDEYNNKWQLLPTGLQDMPFTVTLLEKGEENGTPRTNS